MISKDFKPEILSYDSLDSTNLKLKTLARGGLAEGTVVTAKTQTAGRGRAAHTWHSPVGGLYLSALLSPKDPRRVTDLSLLAGLALAQAVKQSLPKAFDVSVKWPNDVLVNWKKTGGVLCEALGDDFGHSCVVGIGLNVNMAAKELEPFKNNFFGATSFSMETGSDTSLVEVQDILIRKLFDLYLLYQSEGFYPIQYLWEKNCGFVGKKIELRESGWRDVKLVKGDPGATVGTMVGIDDTGALVLSNAKGERRSYFTGEITCFWP